MRFGRLVRCSRFRGDVEAVIYLVAESDPTRAVALVRDKTYDEGAEIEDLGRVTGTLLEALALQPGQISKT